MNDVLSHTGNGANVYNRILVRTQNLLYLFKCTCCPAGRRAAANRALASDSEEDDVAPPPAPAPGPAPPEVEAAPAAKAGAKKAAPKVRRPG